MGRDDEVNGVSLIINKTYLVLSDDKLILLASGGETSLETPLWGKVATQTDTGRTTVLGSAANCQQHSSVDCKRNHSARQPPALQGGTVLSARLGPTRRAWI